MTAPGYTHLTLVLDRSGSMHRTRRAAEEAVNDLLTEQFRSPGRLTVTLTEFDHEVRTVRRITNQAFSYRLHPRGGTALWDAVGDEVRRTGADLAAMARDDRPDRVAFVIVTDGQENASRTYDQVHVRESLSRQRERYGWDIQFLGANESSIQGRSLRVRSVSYGGDAAGTRAAFADLSRGLTQFRA